MPAGEEHGPRPGFLGLVCGSHIRCAPRALKAARLGFSPRAGRRSSGLAGRSHNLDESAGGAALSRSAFSRLATGGRALHSQSTESNLA
jgi:hypothetical protein